MRTTRTLAAVAATTVVLGLGACGQEGSPGAAAPGGSTDGTTAEAPEYEVAEDVELPDSPTYQKMVQEGGPTIGVKVDQPGLGLQPPGADAPEGFDVEIAKLVAADLGFAPEDITWVETVSANREQFLENGTVDLVVATYTINDDRKQAVDFAGPYYVAGQDLLVAADDDTINGPDDLAGKTVCSVTGSTPAQRIEEEFPDTQLVPLGGYAECVEQLTGGQVDAVTTDDAILRGYAAQQPDQLRVVGEAFSEEPYGIGMPLGDTALRDFVNDTLEAAAEDGRWDEAFTYTLGDSEGVEPPAVDRY